MLILAIIALFFIGFDSVQQRKRKPVTRTVYAPAPLSQKEVDRIERGRARAEKAEQAKALAEAELEGIENLRHHYLSLIRDLETERDDYKTTVTRKNAITKQLISLEERLIKLDARRAKLYARAA